MEGELCNIDGSFSQTTPLEIGIWFASLVGKVAMNHDFLIENLGQPASKSQVPYVARAEQGWTEELNQAPNSNATFNRNVSHFPGKKSDPSSWLHITTIRCPEMGGESALKQILSKHVILELDLFTMIFEIWNVFVYDVVVFGEAECDIKSNMLGWEKQFQRFSMHNIIQ